MTSKSINSQAVRKCPKCGNISLSRSQRVDIMDRAVSLLNLYPYRCKEISCNHRFQSFGRY